MLLYHKFKIYQVTETNGVYSTKVNGIVVCDADLEILKLKISNQEI